MALETIPLFVGGVPGGPELVVILLLAVLLFGANKIPKLARSTGEAMGEFQKGREEVEQELQDMRQGGGAEGAAAADQADPEPAGETDAAAVDADATEPQVDSETTDDEQ